MIRPGLVTAAALAAVREAIRVGVSTLELDAIAERVIRDAGGIPNFALEPGYRHTLCTSINDAVVHGVPSDLVLAAGDLVSIDCGADVGGWNGDAAFTVVLPDPSRPELVARREALNSATERSLWAGIAALATASVVNDIGVAVESSIDASGEYGIIEDFSIASAHLMLFSQLSARARAWCARKAWSSATSCTASLVRIAAEAAISEASAVSQRKIRNRTRMRIIIQVSELKTVTYPILT